jgi:hypothetical protein
MILAAAALFASVAQAQMCRACHRAEASSQMNTPMAHAMEPVGDCAILKSHPLLRYKAGDYSYLIRRDGDASIYSVTDGKQTITVPIAWAFGLGAAGQTYVFERGGEWYESRVSFYNAIDGLDLTMGAANRAPLNIEEAAGRKMDAADARDCFNCHATNALRDKTLTLDALTPGIGCERCHGSAAQHLAAVRSGDAAHLAMPKLGALTSEEVSELCGACHRTWSQVAANGPRGVLNVRFQPYRLTNSKCYDAADRRIACTACHNPHDHSVHEAAYYDSKCRACHSAAGSAGMCRVSSQNCVSCHMPKVELPGAHFAFTDHQIRMARAGDAYPN